MLFYFKKGFSGNVIGWGLFDSGNGSYAKVAKEMKIEFYSIGLDIMNKNDHFINLDLADYSYLFGNNKMISRLEELPQPDFIIASPPCESWSIASAMQGGNASWKQEQGDSLFEPQIPLSRFTIRSYKDYEPSKVQFKYDRSFINRINGELTIYNTIKIIRYFNPKYYVIENPATSRIWEYLEDIIGFDISYDNLTYYSNYDYPLMKPTRFKSNLNLHLNNQRTKGAVAFEHFSRDYNERSNIPGKLIREIFTRIENNLECKGN